MAEVAIFNAFSTLRKLQFSIIQLDQTNQLVNSLSTLHKALQKTSPEYLALIKDVHYDILAKVKLGVKEYGKHDSRLISLHDKIFKNQLSMSSIQMNVSRVFEEFIKGITYFRQQLNPLDVYPVYHRLHSCGPNNPKADETYRHSNMVCPGGLSRTEKQRRKALTERCYIERLIFDAIYKHEALHNPDRGNTELEQDDGHLHRLELVRKDFQTCFRDINIEVDVGYDSNFPVSLSIKRFKKGKLFIEEHYEKTLGNVSNRLKVYDEGVKCTRHIIGGMTFTKINIFEMEQDWTRARP